MATSNNNDTKVTVSSKTSDLDYAIHAATGGAIRAEPTYTAKASRDGETSTGRSNDREAAVQAALDGLKK